MITGGLMPTHALADSLIVFSGQPDALYQIAKPEVGLAVWHREIPDTVCADLERLTGAGFPAVRLLAQVWDITAALQHEIAGSNHDAAVQWLIADIGDLATRFALIAGTELVDIRCEILQHDACWRFHRDNVNLRLVATYIGPGTEIVPCRDGARALRLQREYPGPTLPLPTGSVALFKGGEAAGGGGIVHRSPPIKAAGLSRLFLSINSRFDACPELWQRY
jgi:hypothetical protein